MATKVRPGDVKIDDARRAAERLIHHLDGMAYHAPELLTHDLAEASKHANAIAGALCLIGGPK